MKFFFVLLIDHNSILNLSLTPACIFLSCLLSGRYLKINGIYVGFHLPYPTLSVLLFRGLRKLKPSGNNQSVLCAYFFFNPDWEIPAMGIKYFLQSTWAHGGKLSFHAYPGQRENKQWLPALTTIPICLESWRFFWSVSGQDYVLESCQIWLKNWCTLSEQIRHFVIAAADLGADVNHLSYLKWP